MWKRVILAVVAILVLVQVPFVSRRYKLHKLSAAIQQINSQRRTTEGSSKWTEYKGVVHVHSFLGGHSSGTFSDIIAAAKANQLDFVIMPEHTERDFDTGAMTLKGVHNGVLFINGN